MSQARWSVAAAILVLVLAGLSIQQATLAPKVAFDTLGSATVPYVVAAALIALIVVALIRDFRDGRLTAQVEPQSTDDRAAALKSVAVLLAFFATVALVQLTAVPFAVAAFVFIALASRLLAPTRRGLWLSLVVAAVTALGIEFVFSQMLLVELP